MEGSELYNFSAPWGLHPLGGPTNFGQVKKVITVNYLPYVFVHLPFTISIQPRFPLVKIHKVSRRPSTKAYSTPPGLLAGYSGGEEKGRRERGEYKSWREEGQKAEGENRKGEGREWGIGGPHQVWKQIDASCCQTFLSSISKSRTQAADNKHWSNGYIAKKQRQQNRVATRTSGLGLTSNSCLVEQSRIKLVGGLEASLLGVTRREIAKALRWRKICYWV